MICSEEIEPAAMSAIARIDPQMIAETRAREQAQAQLALLGELAEIGLEVARAVERRAKEATPDEDLNGLAMAYARVARAVRLTIMLQSNLLEASRRSSDRADIRGRPSAAVSADPAYRRKARVERIVERIAEAEHDDEAVVDRLVVEAQERLDDEDLHGAVLERPLGELVALICRDLGLSPDWGRLAGEAWAREEIVSGAEGSPFISPLRLDGGGEDVAGGDRSDRSGGDLAAAPSPAAQGVAPS